MSKPPDIHGVVCWENGLIVSALWCKLLKCVALPTLQYACKRTSLLWCAVVLLYVCLITWLDRLVTSPISIPEECQTPVRIIVHTFEFHKWPKKNIISAVVTETGSGIDLWL